jgi:hypothetical protein
MTSEISQTAKRLHQALLSLRTQIHDAGIEPSVMNRFAHSEPHEVNFAN